VQLLMKFLIYVDKFATTYVSL